MFDLGRAMGDRHRRRSEVPRRSVGVELDKDLCKQSAAENPQAGLEKNAHIVNGDLLQQNYSSADLLPSTCCRMR
jgi:hypothetical protein